MNFEFERVNRTVRPVSQPIFMLYMHACMYAN